MALKTEVIDKLFLHEYFLINITEHVKLLEAFMKDPLTLDPKNQLNKGIREIIKENLSFQTTEIDLLLKNMRGHGEQRYGVTVDIDFAANLLIDEDLIKSKQ